jgi:hypothetical protein
MTATDTPADADHRFGDFTEDGYRAALDSAAAHWTFEGFGAERDRPHVLWRHDIDVSPHRALRLAQIERERGLKATYFFHLHSHFYNALDASVRDIAQRISGLGHDLGLHFDASFYGELADVAALERHIGFEADIIAQIAGVRPVAVSFHNPTAEQLARFDQLRLSGLVNAYGAPLRQQYRYVSDSNGYWRHHRLHDVLAARADPRLHVLTHPEWWTPDRRSPRERIVRAVEGRAARVLQDYDALLDSLGRLNVR